MISTEARPDQLRRSALRAARALDGAAPGEILGWALERFHPRLAIASSMTDAVLVHLASQLRAEVPVLFLDTGYHFAETLGTRDAVAAAYPVRLLSVTPQHSVAEQDRRAGPRLYQRDPDRCCALRKVGPLEQALAPFLAWASGIRRDEATSRAGMGVVEWDERRGKVKVNPLANWTADDVATYIAANQVLVNPLVEAGYRSIGCQPCTRPVRVGEDARAGRWAGRAKNECGLHG